MLDAVFQRSALASHATETEWQGGLHRQYGLANRHDPIRFGAFEILPAARTLLLRGMPVDLGSRAFDLLMTLVASRGEIVSKDAIMRAVWPTTTVDESNLRFQMTCLRRALRDERVRIKTVPGRGYLFVAERQSSAEMPLGLKVGPAEADDPPIVIIDGDPQNRERLSRLLAATGARVMSFATVAAFLTSSPLAHGRLLPRHSVALAA
jgi:DNA-binding winged helix-turn-helix (wHTH) protein